MVLIFSHEKHTQNSSNCIKVSLKTYQNLEERFLYNRVHEKGTHKIWQEHKRSDQVKTYAPGKSLREKGRLHGWRFALGNERLKPHPGCPSPGVQHRECKERCWDYQFSMRPSLSSADTPTQPTSRQSLHRSEGCNDRGKDVKKGGTFTLLVGCKLVQPLWKTVRRLLKTLKTSVGSSNPTVAYTSPKSPKH